MAALCRRVAAGELAADEAVRAAPFPAEFARDALALSAPRSRPSRRSSSRYSQTRVTSRPKAAYHSM